MNERDLVENIKSALDDSLERMDEATRTRLYFARREVLNPSRHALQGNGVLVLASQHPWSLMFVLALGVAMAAWFGMRAPPAESGEVDILLLTGDIPPQAYADWRLVRHGDVGPQCLTER